MSLVCGIDFETTGLDAEKDEIIEIGAAIFDGDTWEPKETLSLFVNPGVQLPQMIVELTHITDEMLKDGVTPTLGIHKLDKFSESCEFNIAHNSAFDMGMALGSIKRHDIRVSDGFKKRPWLCSKGDVKSHAGKKCTKLSHLALDYGCNVDGSKLHRALEDVLLMGEMLKKAAIPASEIYRWRTEPWVYFQAMVDGPWKDGGVSTKAAKESGYAWERCVGTHEPVFPKMWVKRVKESEEPAERAKVESFKRLTVKYKEQK